MFAILAVVFVVAPLVELVVLIQVGQAVGVWTTIGLLLSMSVVGAWFMKREGIGVYRRIQASISAGRVPAKELIDAFLILLGGALMLAPGFISDVFGILLLLPPVRVVVRRLVAVRLARMAVPHGARRIIEV